MRPRWPYDMRPSAEKYICHCNSLGGATWRSITGRTDRRTDRVQRNMRPPPREEGRITNKGNVSCSIVWKHGPFWSPTRTHHGSVAHNVSVTVAWYTPVSSRLQCSSAPEIWFVNQWWHPTSLSLICGPVASLDPGVSAHDASRWAWWRLPMKVESQ